VPATICQRRNCTWLCIYIHDYLLILLVFVCRPKNIQSTRARHWDLRWLMLTRENSPKTSWEHPKVTSTFKWDSTKELPSRVWDLSATRGICNDQQLYESKTHKPYNDIIHLRTTTSAMTCYDYSIIFCYTRGSDIFIIIYYIFFFSKSSYLYTVFFLLLYTVSLY